MSANVFFPRKPSACAGRAVLAALAFVLASPIDATLAQADAQPGTPVFTIIVTRHGVRAPSSTPAQYDWPDWGNVGADNLTGHGYRLMRLMGRVYRQKQNDKNLPVDCSAKTAYVYADTAARTLATARALIEGLCGSADALEVFHTADGGVDDPIFDASSRLWQTQRMHRSESKAAVATAAGSPFSSRVMQHAADFNAFQELLATRCSKGGCRPIAGAASSIELSPRVEVVRGQDPLAGLKGPIATASTYAEDVFLEFAQCRPEAEMTRLGRELLHTDLAAGMRLHVLAYDVNARNAYNPLVRGGTLIAHVAAMLDRKAGRAILDRIKIPELTGKTLVVFSGHDTQLGALGGILNAHWSPEGGIVPDDMPPGSALIFDLMKGPANEYGVRLRFVSMAREQFRSEQLLTDGLNFVDVKYPACPAGGCVVALEQFESLALTLEAQGFVDDGWNASSAPLPLALLADPTWTDAKCGGH